MQPDDLRPALEQLALRPETKQTNKRTGSPAPRSPSKQTDKTTPIRIARLCARKRTIRARPHAPTGAHKPTVRTAAAAPPRAPPPPPPPHLWSRHRIGPRQHASGGGQPSPPTNRRLRRRSPCGSRPTHSAVTTRQHRRRENRLGTERHSASPAAANPRPRRRPLQRQPATPRRAPSAVADRLRPTATTDVNCGPERRGAGPTAYGATPDCAVGDLLRPSPTANPVEDCRRRSPTGSRLGRRHSTGHSPRPAACVHPCVCACVCVHVCVRDRLAACLQLAAVCACVRVCVSVCVRSLQLCVCARVRMCLFVCAACV